MLGPFVLTLDHDPGWKVGDPHCGIGLVDVLSSCSTRPKGIDSQLFLVDLESRCHLKPPGRRKPKQRRYDVSPRHQKAICEQGDEFLSQPSGNRRHKDLLTVKVTFFSPASSPGRISMISVLNSFFSPHLRYILRSISTQSCASVPPAPALILTMALLMSDSPPEHPLELDLADRLFGLLNLIAEAHAPPARPSAPQSVGGEFPSPPVPFSPVSRSICYPEERLFLSEFSGPPHSLSQK